MAPLPEPFFLDLDAGPLGRRFAVLHLPHGPVHGQVVHVHPFADEMNKARRMTALQSRALAAAGFAVLQIDLLGCGDSAGDFGDATWVGWVDDVVLACRWLQRRLADAAPVGQAAAPLWLWGLRAGCLLAAEAARRLPVRCNLLLWQPPTSGKPLLQQFLRLKVAGDALGGQAKGAMALLRGRLASGEPVEVAGYTLNPALCHGLEATALRPPAAPCALAGRVEWLELSSLEDAALSPASSASAAQWAEAGWSVRTRLARGPAFWHTTEVAEAPALLDATLAALAAPAGVAAGRAEPVRA